MKFPIGSIIQHPEFGEGAIIGASDSRYRIYFQDIGEKELSIAYDGYELIEEGEAINSSVTLEDVIDAVQNVFDQYYDVTHHVDLGSKWEGGSMILKPGNDDLKSKEIPIETFFHKIVMVRDRLRVMEQQINAHDKLTDEEKVNLQQYITRIYGSLTTFNVLFDRKSDHFVGERSGD